jgi:hypothetical protein
VNDAVWRFLFCFRDEAMKRLFSWFVTPKSQRAALVLIFSVGAVWVVLRFCALERTPPGFFVDEARPAVHAMCLKETGRDLDGLAWPLYSSSTGGGQHALTQVGFDVLWIGVFGTSRAAFRAVSAFWILVAAFGLFLMARDIAALMPVEATDGLGRSARRAFPWLVLLAALVSPWSFQFSRFAHEGSVAPTFLVLSLVGLMRAHRGGRWSVPWSILAGFFAAASMTTYPPLRVVVPPVFATTIVLLLGITRGWRARYEGIRNMAVAAGVAFACFAPTLRLLFLGKINQRMNSVVIWNEGWVNERAGAMGHAKFILMTFFDNLLAHLRPSFLFIRGDDNMRHSAHVMGQLSLVDTLAITLACWMALMVLFSLVRGRSLLPDTPELTLSNSSRGLLTISLCAMLGYIFGVLPSALTWEGMPTALRAGGAWPFVSLFTGAIFSLVWSKRKWFPPLLALVAVAHTVLFVPAYFHAYDKAENYWFMRDMADAIEQESREQPPKTVPQTVANHLGYGYGYDEVLRYYLMSQAHMKCEESASAVRGYWDEARGK